MVGKGSGVVPSKTHTLFVLVTRIHTGQPVQLGDRLLCKVTCDGRTLRL